MAAWQPTEGATLLMPSGPEGDHLFVVLNNPAVFPGYGPRPHVLLVGVSTVRSGFPHDATCVLVAGCHKFVKRESYAVYRHARIEPAVHVEQLVKQSFFRPQDPLPPELLNAIRAGLQASPFTKREFKQLEF